MLRCEPLFNIFILEVKRSPSRHYEVLRATELDTEWSPVHNNHQKTFNIYSQLRNVDMLKQYWKCLSTVI